MNADEFIDNIKEMLANNAVYPNIKGDLQKVIEFEVNSKIGEKALNELASKIKTKLYQSGKLIDSERSISNSGAFYAIHSVLKKHFKNQKR